MFQVATVELIEQRSLLKRVDTKFVMREEKLPELLSLLTGDYAAIHVNGSNRSKYRNQYFDTADFQCLSDHRRGKRPRFKARVRHHVDRELSFLEVKRKSPSDETEKTRRVRPFLDESLDQEALSFVASCSTLPAEELLPRLEVRFTRSTLVGLERNERITFDTNLHFKADENTEECPELAIIEVKQDRFHPRSPVMLALQKVRADRLSISKYCLGVHLVIPDANTAWYGRKIHTLKAILNG